MKKLYAVKKWEVKAGKNRGLYVHATRKQSSKFFPEWGILFINYNVGLYRYHHVPEEDVILTHSIWARHVMRKSWEKIITQK
jgi:hypothetical protein